MSRAGLTVSPSPKPASEGPTLLEIIALLDDGLPTTSAELAAVIAEATSVELNVVSGASVPADAVGIGVFGSNGQLKTANALFEQCVANDAATSVALLALRKRAEAHGRAIALVPARDEGMVCALAVSRPLAEQWPILDTFMQSAAGDARAVAVVILSPSRSGESFGRTASAAGLSNLETRLAHALLEQDTLQDAADAVGVARETAKTAIANAARRVNARNTAELLGILVDLSCTPLAGLEDEAATARLILGLTQAEARVASALAHHRSINEIAAVLEMKRETVKTHQRAIFAKLGVHRNRTFRRLFSEALALNSLATRSEVRSQAVETNRLKLIFAASGRRVAFVDYGPRNLAPVFVGHGDTTGRLLPDRLVAALRARGLRPVVLQRPGFGLTARASDFLADAAGDMALVLDTLKVERAHLLMRDGGVATGLEFAVRFPARVGQAVLQNPRQPNGIATHGPNPLGPLQRYLRLHPVLLEPIGEMLRRQSRGDFLRAILRHVAEAVPADKALIQDEQVVDSLVGDMHGLISLTATGFVEERRVFSDGWQPPKTGLGGRWTVAASGALFADAVRTPWEHLPGVTFVVIPEAGTFVQYTHPEEVAALFTDVTA